MKNCVGMRTHCGLMDLQITKPAHRTLLGVIFALCFSVLGFEPVQLPSDLIGEPDGPVYPPFEVTKIIDDDGDSGLDVMGFGLGILQSDTSESLLFINRPQFGDFDIAARLELVEAVKSTAQVGIMVRERKFREDGSPESLPRSTSEFMSIGVYKNFFGYPENYSVSWRNIYSEFREFVGVHPWHRLKRQGNSLITFVGDGPDKNNIIWTQVGMKRIENWNNETFVGFYIFSSNSPAGGEVPTPAFAQIRKIHTIEAADVPAIDIEVREENIYQELGLDTCDLDGVFVFVTTYNTEITPVVIGGTGQQVTPELLTSYETDDGIQRRTWVLPYSTMLHPGNTGYYPIKAVLLNGDNAIVAKCETQVMITRMPWKIRWLDYPDGTYREVSPYVHFELSSLTGINHYWLYLNDILVKEGPGNPDPTAKTIVTWQGPPTAPGVNVLKVVATNGKRKIVGIDPLAEVPIVYEGYNGRWHSSTKEFVVDTNGPTFAEGFPPQGKYYNKRSVAIKGTYDEEVVFQISSVVDGESFVRPWGPAFLREGEHTVVETVEDGAGNRGSGRWSFFVDLTPPDIEVISPRAGQTVSASALISIRVTDAMAGVKTVKVEIDGTEVPATYQNGFYSVQPQAALAHGTHILRVWAEDDTIGFYDDLSDTNESESLTSFYVDSVAPWIYVFGANGGTLTIPRGPNTLHGILERDSSTILATSANFGNLIPFVEATASVQTFSIDLIANEIGTFSVTLTAQDKLGNETTKNVAIKVVENVDTDGDQVSDSVDTDPLVADEIPGVTVNQPTEGQIFNKLTGGIITVAGEITNDDSVTLLIFIDNVVELQETAGPGPFQKTFAVEDGSHAVRVVVIEDEFRSARSEQRSIVVDTLDPSFFSNNLTNSISYPFWPKGHVQDEGPLATGITEIRINEQYGLLNGSGSPTAKFEWMGRLDDIPPSTDTLPVKVTDRAGNSVMFNLWSYNLARSTASLVVNKTYRVAVQEGDTLLVDAYPQQETGEFLARSVSTEGSSVTPPVDLNGNVSTYYFPFLFSVSCEQGRIPYPTTGSDYDLSFDVYQKSDEGLVGRVFGLIDVYKLQMTPSTLTVSGRKIHTVAPATLSSDNPALKPFRIYRPMRGDTPGLGVCTLKVYAGGEVVGLGDIRLWYDPNSEGTPEVGTELVQYTGQPIPIAAIDETGKTFYVEGTWPSGRANDTAIVLEYEPLRTETYDYKKTCVKVLQITVGASTARLLVDANHDGQIEKETDQPYQTQRFGALFLRGFATGPGLDNHLDYRARVKVKIERDEGFSGPLTLTGNNQYTGVFLEPEGGSPLFKQGSHTWPSADDAPQFVYVEYPADDQVMLELISDVTKLDEIKITTFSNGLGANALSPTTTVLPGFSSVNLNTGNVHFAAAKETFQTPKLGPNLSYVYNLLDGMDRGNGRGWRSNYDIQIFDGAADPNKDGTIDLSERSANDLLVVIDETGRRYPFRYDPAESRFISIEKGGLKGSEIIPPDVEGNYYKLMRYDNFWLYFNLNGLLNRIERTDTWDVTTIFGENDVILSAEDKAPDKRIVNVKLVKDEQANAPKQLSGGQLPALAFEYELSIEDVIPIPRMKSIKVSGESHEMPTATTGQGGTTFSQVSDSVVLTFDNFERDKNRPKEAIFGDFSCNIEYGDATSTATAYSGGVLSLNFNRTLDAWTQINTPGNIITARQLDTELRHPVRDTTGQRKIAYGFDERGAMNSYSDNAGLTWTAVYEGEDGIHLMKSKTVSGIGETTYTYKNNFWLGSVTNPENETTGYAYASPGFLSSTTTPRGTWTHQNLTPYGNYRRTISPEQRETAYSILEIYGLYTSTRDWLGYSYATGYDSRHRVVSQSKPGATARTVYSMLSYVMGTSDYSGTYVVESRDVLGRSTGVGQPGIGKRKITWAGGLGTINSVDTRVEGLGSPARRLSTTNYDYDGRVVKVLVPIVLQPNQAATNSVTDYEYTDEGWLHTVSDPRGNETKTTYELDAKKITVTLPRGGVYVTQYDAAWRPITHTAPDGELSTTGYDGLSRVISTVNPAGGEVNTTYWPDGPLASITRVGNGGPYGRPISYGYDTDNNQTSVVDILGLQTQTSIDATTRSITSVTDANPQRASTSYLNGSANVNLVTTPFGNTSLTPTADGFVTSATAPGRNPITQSRDSLNRNTSMGFSTGGTNTVQFHPQNGDVTSSTSVLSLTTTFNRAPQTGDFNNATDNVDGAVSPAVASVVRRDRCGNTLEFRDAMQRHWVQRFDEENNRILVTAPDQTSTRFTYTLGGKLESVRNENGVTTYKYNPLGLVREVVDASSRKTVREYDSFGLLLKETKGSEVTEYTYDPDTKLLVSTRKGSQRMEIERDRFGRAHRVRDAKNNEHVYEYDDADRVVKHTYPDQKFETVEYQPNGPDPVAFTDRAGRRSEVQLDGAGRIAEIRHTADVGGAQTVRYGYNAANQVVQESLNGISAAKSYDARGRLRSLTQPTGAVTYDYLNDGKVSTVTTAEGLRSFIYDDGGRLQQMTAAGGTASMTYDPKGRLDTMTLPNGVSRKFVYGQAGRVARMEQTLPGVTDPITEKYAYSYDGEGRLIRVTVPGGNYRYAYDEEGRLAEEVSVWNEPYSTRYSYDANGNRTAVERYEQAETKTYNFNGNALPAGAAAQSGTWSVSNGFATGTGLPFARLNLTPLRDTTTLYQERLLVAVAGMVEGEERRAGVTFGITLEGSYGAYLSVRLSAGTLQQRVKILRRDAMGVETLLKESGERIHTDAYWTLEVLVSDIIQARVMQDGTAATLVRVEPETAAEGGVALEAWGSLGVSGVSVDHFRWQGFTDAARTWNYTYNALNQLLNVNGAETATYNYNDMGQLSRRTAGDVQTDYEYDRLGRLASVTAPGLNQSFAYAGASWMRQNSTLNGVSTSYLYDGHNCIAQTTAGATTRYAHFGARALWESVDGALPTTYLDNGQGSVGGLVSASGVQARFRYDAYGRMKSYGATNTAIANTSGPRFKGEMYDASIDQVFLRNRYYDPNLGRFSTLDPKGMVDGPNMYAYCGGDPVNHIDPTGTTVKIGNEIHSDGGVPIGMSDLDFLFAEMSKSKNVYTFRNWNEYRQIMSNQDNVAWILKDLGISWTQIQTKRGRFEHNDSKILRNVLLKQQYEQWQRETGEIRNARNPHMAALAMLGGVHIDVAEVNAQQMAMAIPHIAVAFNGVEGTVNAYNGDYKSTALNVAGILLSRSQGVEFEQGAINYAKGSRVSIPNTFILDQSQMSTRLLAARRVKLSKLGMERKSARLAHDEYLETVRPGATERVFETPWSAGKGLGSRKFDDFDDLTMTGFEANTTPWGEMTLEQLTRKLDQVAADFALLKTRPNEIKRVIWFGTEELPTSGLGNQLREALEQAGIPYFVVKP